MKFTSSCVVCKRMKKKCNRFPLKTCIEKRFWRERECHAIGMRVFLEIHEGTSEGQDDSYKEKNWMERNWKEEEISCSCCACITFSSHSSPLKPFFVLYVRLQDDDDLDCSPTGFTLSFFPCYFRVSSSSFLPHVYRTRGGQHNMYKKHNKNVHVTCHVHLIVYYSPFTDILSLLFLFNE